MEAAVDDALALIKGFPLGPDVAPVAPGALAQLKAHYTSLAYRALLAAVRASLSLLKKRVCSRAGSGYLFAQRPFFDVDVQLSVPSVRLAPALADVQQAINRAAVAVIGSSKKVWQWGQAGVPVAEKTSFFDILGCDMEIIKVLEVWHDVPNFRQNRCDP